MTKRKYYHYCYLIHDSTNGMKYFGVRTSEVPAVADKKYMGSGTKILEAMKVSGKDKFKKEILETFNTRDDAMEYEEWYMAEHDCVDSPEYYNLSARSTGGRFDYHEDLKDGHTKSPQEKNGAQKNFDKPTDFVTMTKPDSANATIVAEREAMENANQDYTVNKDGSTDKRIHHKGNMGGKRPGAGRPKGSKSIFSKKSVEKLQELGVDPMEELVRTYNQVCTDIENTKSISARTALYNTRQKIMSDLMKYGYRPIPREEKKEISVEDKGPMSIILTDEEDVKEKDDKETKR